jgi:hypothetical protein
LNRVISKASEGLATGTLGFVLRFKLIEKSFLGSSSKEVDWELQWFQLLDTGTSGKPFGTFTGSGSVIFGSWFFCNFRYFYFRFLLLAVSISSISSSSASKFSSELGIIDFTFPMVFSLMSFNFAL